LKHENVGIVGKERKVILQIIIFLRRRSIWKGGGGGTSIPTDFVKKIGRK